MAEREIKSCVRYKTGHGTHYFDVEYTGEWGNLALINAVDLGKHKPTEDEYNHLNSPECLCNWGGFVEPLTATEEGNKRARVGVYYD